MKPSIITAAIIIGGSILLNGYFNRQFDKSTPINNLSSSQHNLSSSPHNHRPTLSMVESSITESLKYALHGLQGDNIIMDKKRDVQSIEIGTIRYSLGDDSMLVDFALLCADGDKITSSARLDRGEFFVYRGAWEFGDKTAVFKIENS